jgi:hypothetical protein
VFTGFLGTRARYVVSVHTVYRGDVPRRPLGTTCRHVSSAHAIAESVCRGQVPRDKRTRGKSKAKFEESKAAFDVWGLKGRSPSPAPCYWEPRSGRNSNTGRLAKTIWTAGHCPVLGQDYGNSYLMDGPPNWRPRHRSGVSW